MSGTNRSARYEVKGNDRRKLTGRDTRPVRRSWKKYRRTQYRTTH